MTTIINTIKTELIIVVTLFFTFLTPVHGLFYMVGTAVLIDTSYAIYYTIKKNGWESFNSHKLFNVVVKTFFYMSTIFLSFMASNHITDGELFSIDLFLPKFTSALWVFIELKSIDETNVKFGNNSILITIKKILNWLKLLKKDITDLKK
tara:strand:- start:11775 stop:12224 length:450 start_codon:yes stop_codon:yes gene_type:complete